MAIVIATPFTVAVIVLPVPVSPSVIVVMFSERRRYRQNTYRRSKGKFYNNLAAD